MEPPQPPRPENDVDAPRKLIANIPEEVLATLRSTCAAKAEVSLLGRIHGKHPGLKALMAWARDSLHPSLSMLSLKTNNLFEVTFSHPDLVCDTAAIFFSSWRPHFDPQAPQAEESLDHPVWVQIVDLCHVLREESFLKLIGEQIGQVISIDNSEAYRAKLFGPRIRLLVQDIHQLPQKVVIPRLDGEGTVEYTLEFSGLPKQCGRCRAYDHLVRNCPKKVPPARKREGIQRHKEVEPKSDSPKKTEQEGAAEDKEDDLIQPSQEQTQQLDRSLEDSSNTAPHITNTQEKLRTSPTLQALDGSDWDDAETSHQVVSPQAVHCQLTPEDKGNTPEEELDALQPDDINFPKLQTPSPAARGTPVSPTPDTSSKKLEPKFVWKSAHITKSAHKSAEGNKGKEKLPESVPITRQGYRSGRLADDFWSGLDMPNTPTANPKMLRVVPFLTKNRHTEPEYLVDQRGHTFGAIAHVHIVEVLAGVPWTPDRAKQHVVNEVSQTLHKLLIFNNNLSNPFQTWQQGRWFAQWKQGADGEHICTLFVSIDVPEQKVKPRKGNQMGWRRESREVSQILATLKSEEIQPFESDYTQWTKMARRLPNSKTFEQSSPESHNRFATLLENEVEHEQ